MVDGMGTDRYRISFGGDGNVLKLESGDGWTNL